MEFRIATMLDKKNILEYYMELDNENAKVSRLKTYNEKILIEWIESRFTKIFLLYDEELLVSVIKANLGQGDESHCACLNISTRQAYRNNGYAKLLISYSSNELKKNKIKIIRVKIFSWNKPAIVTIEKAGFTLSGRIVMSHYDEDLCDYIDDLLYHKFL